MKLKYRLIINFLFVVFVPILLTVGVFFGMRSLVSSSWKQNYGIDTEDDIFSYGSSYLLGHFSEAAYDRIAKAVEEGTLSADAQEDYVLLNEDIAAFNSYLIVEKDGSYVYYGNEDADTITSGLPAYEGTDGYADVGLYYSGQTQQLIKKIDFLYADGSEGSIYVVTEVENTVPEVRTFIIDMMISVVCILFFTSLAMTMWTYRGIVTPIKRLQDATRNIRDGNLNFSIEACTADEIGDLCNDFEDMRRQLKASEEEKNVHDKEHSDLIRNISHDLKTPITSIRGYVEGIMDGVADTPEKQERYLKIIHNKTREMEALINELTLYSKIDTNRIPYDFKIVSLADFFQDCAEEIGMDLEKQNIGLAYENFSAPGTRIIADAEQLKRVIANIINNSVKYIDKPVGFIRMTLRDVDNCVQIEIEDTCRISLTASIARMNPAIPPPAAAASVCPSSKRSSGSTAARSGPPRSRERAPACLLS